INESFYLLIDIGGEDTKISVISLESNELFDNAMNIKCSAGTGSLMDTLKTLFDIEKIEDAYTKAFKAVKAYGINATCAVFLMENARKMQAEGYSKDEILASCCYAIVENMARSLWNQVDFPENTIVLLHGQTMLSDPLPLAVTHRVQEYTGRDTYCLVPPFPGHRACIGLIKSFEKNKLSKIEQFCRLDDLLNKKFEKRIIFCRGAACGDDNACCARTKLVSQNHENRISLTLGGCTAVNELQARKQTGEKIEVPDAYREIWKFIDNKLPKSSDERRLVIPRSFAVSQKAYFFAKIFEQFDIPVHVDNVRESDVIKGQPLFTIDTCAPNIGAAGQFLRLAEEPHAFILVPQIDFLQVEGESLGRTCTTNQGGVLIAYHFAKRRFPNSKFKIFDINLKNDEPGNLTDQLFGEFRDVFKYYDAAITRDQFKQAVIKASEEFRALNESVAEFTASFIEEVISKKLNMSIISAREYILMPGIYDSHVGKLLKDKGVAAFPAYVFDINSDPYFDFIYWKNPHDLMSQANAIARKKFHEIIKNDRLSKLVKRIETGGTDTLLSLVTVSTFRCGPDSVTLPILAEITKNTPTLLIQSDAMIAELAHLENRVNTHLNQLKKSLHQHLAATRSDFSIQILDKFNLDGLNKEKDVLYFPTAGDNRAVTSLFRAAGLTVIDNFDDDSYDLEQKARLGRKYVGDSTCVPLASVFADMLGAVDDFHQKKKAGDPLVEGKDRIVLFMHTGDGPCRLGQYINLFKLNFHRFNNGNGNGTTSIKFLENLSSSLSNDRDYLSVIDKWASLQAFQAGIVKGVLHAVFLKGGANCHNYEEFAAFTQDYRKLKNTVYNMLENEIEPGRFAQYLVDQVEQKIPKLKGLAQYFGYGLYNNNGLRKVFKEFAGKWIHNNNGNTNGKKVSVHVEGEIYLRVSQLEEIFKIMVDTIGFNSFNLSYTPMWSFFEYVLESRILIANKNIILYQEKLFDSIDSAGRKQLNEQIDGQRKHIAETQKTINNLRNILADPLYKAAGLAPPDRMRKVFDHAKSVLPKYKPFGELVPFVGETISQLSNGTNLVLNVAPEGCMVASMGEMLNTKMMESVNKSNARIQHLFTNEGEINEDMVQLSLLKIIGTEDYYSAMEK
ncbi:MAG: acyl-CoA dehydratase activase-related protein, partial [Calditrichaceae bacterium]